MREHKTPIQIRFKDIDALGHVNNANHLTYFELARVRFFDEVVSEAINWSESGMILAKITIDYKKMIGLNDTIFIYTSFVRSGNTSFELYARMVREEKDGTETVVAQGNFVLVCFSYKTNSPVPVPASWLEKLRSFENKN